jgi:hypothetical protein
MSRAQIDEKFYDCAAQAIAGDPARKIHGTLAALGEQASFADFWPLLRRA